MFFITNLFAIVKFSFKVNSTKSTEKTHPNFIVGTIVIIIGFVRVWNKNLNFLLIKVFLSLSIHATLRLSLIR